MIKEKFFLICKFLRENSLVVFLFSLSTLFFLTQHYFHLAWDFSAYVLNAKYFFTGGTYFEVYRAPMVSFILGIFLWLGFGKFSEYLFIFLVSILFLFSLIKISNVIYLKFSEFFKKNKISKNFFMFLFYFFMLSPFFLYYGMLVGTELIALSFFILFVAFLLEGKISGYWLGLAVLARYNFLFFSPLLFFNRSIKKILKNLLSFFVVLSPWLLYNFFMFGNWVASIVDSYYLNVFNRQNLIQAVHWKDFLSIFGFFTPFFLVGLFVFFFIVYKRFFSKGKKYNSLFLVSAVFFIVLVFILFDFFNTPFKIKRYLFNIVFPIAYFSSLGLCFLWGVFLKKISFKKTKKIKKLKIILIILFLIFFLISLNLLVFNSVKFSLNGNNMYKNSVEDIRIAGFEDCLVLSAHWVPVNYFNEQFFFQGVTIEEAFLENEAVLIFQNSPTMDDKYSISELEKYNVLIETRDYILLAPVEMTNQTCKRWEGYNEPLVENPCEIISQKFNFFNLENFVFDSCEFFNFK